jgi:hypothetical protein
MPFLVTCSDGGGSAASSCLDIPLRYGKQAHLLYHLLEDQASAGLAIEADPQSMAICAKVIH